MNDAATNQYSESTSRQSLRYWLPILLGAAFLCGIFFLLVQAALHKELNHDENMYVSSGVLLQRGRLPYIDYPFFQMPLSTLVYASTLWSSSNLLLAARLINTTFTFLTSLVLFFGVLRICATLPQPRRVALAVAGVILFVSNPNLLYSAGLAWNHDLPILLTVLGLALLAWSFARTRATLLLLLSGLLFGLAISTRLSFAATLVPLGLALLAVPTSSGVNTIIVRARRCLLYCVGVLMGLLPSLVFLWASPAAFWFGNVSYHQLNEQFWKQSSYTRAITFDGKIAYLADVIRAEPFNWLLLAGSVLIVFLVWRTRSPGTAPLPIYLAAMTALSLFAVALIPSPTWLQYFYAPYMLVVFTFVYGVAYLAEGKWGRVSQGALIIVAVVCVVSIAPRYLALAGKGETVPAQLHRTALEIRSAVGTKGHIATLAPIYALEAGLDIYPELASGPFALRVADFLSPEDRESLRVWSLGDLDRMLSQRPPEALLVGLEGELEEPLIKFAANQGYTRLTLSTGLTLWVRVDATPESRYNSEQPNKR